MNNEEQIIDEDLDQDTLDDESEEKPNVPSWSTLPYIPNKKRFIILTTVFSVVELTGMLILAYAFLGSFQGGLWDLGLFLMPPFTGVAIAYFVKHQKEAVAVSFVNAITSIVIFWIIFLSVEASYSIPEAIGALTWLDYVIPIAMIFIQVAIAYTISRLRNIYRYYGDSSIARESDEAMIAELKESRRQRGLEPLAEDDAGELNEEKESK